MVMFDQGGLSNEDYKFLARLSLYPGPIHVANEADTWHDLVVCMESNAFPCKNLQELLENLPAGFAPYLQEQIDEMKREIYFLTGSMVKFHRCLARNKFMKLFELYFRVKFEKERAEETNMFFQKSAHVMQMNIFLDEEIFFIKKKRE